MSARDRRGVTVHGPGLTFPSATAFERHPDGSLSVFEGEDVVAVLEPGYEVAFMSGSAAPR